MFLKITFRLPLKQELNFSYWGTLRCKHTERKRIILLETR